MYEPMSTVLDHALLTEGSQGASLSLLYQGVLFQELACELQAWAVVFY